MGGLSAGICVCPFDISYHSLNMAFHYGSTSCPSLFLCPSSRNSHVSKDPCSFHQNVKNVNVIKMITPAIKIWSSSLWYHCLQITLLGRAKEYMYICTFMCMHENMHLHQYFSFLLKNQFTYHKNPPPFFFCVVVLGFWSQGLTLASRHTTTWAMSPALFSFFIFGIESLIFAQACLGRDLPIYTSL